MTTVREDPIEPSYDRKTTVSAATRPMVRESVSRTDSEPTTVRVTEGRTEKLRPAGSPDSVGEGV
jgi:hypothetical protein